MKVLVAEAGTVVLLERPLFEHQSDSLATGL